MTHTVIQQIFSPLKRFLPSWVCNLIRSIGTAFIGPVLAAYRTGYLRSAFKMAAVAKNGDPIPWYTYPAIDFLKYRDYADRIILEFGGGQSSLWWAARARLVVTFEGEKKWYDKIKMDMPDNMDLCYVSMEFRQRTVSKIIYELGQKAYSVFDVIIIDGLYREEMVQIALDFLSENGIIICDNAEGYGFYEAFKESGLWRVDFFGNAPGVVLPHSTSIYFRPSSCFLFDAKYPVPVIATEN